MSSRMAGSVLLRHAGAGAGRLFATTSPAARSVLAGGEGAWVRMMSTSAASQAKDEAAKAVKAEAAKGDGEKKEVAVNSYWGIEQSKKLVREDGTEWKWSCFRIGFAAAAMGDVHRGHVDRSDQAPRAQHDARQDRLLHRQVAPLPHRHLLPEEVRLPRNDAGDCCRGAGDGGRHAPTPALPPALRAERRVDPRAAGGGRERAHAPHDLHGGGAAEVVRARARHRRPGRLLQRLFLRLPHLPQVRAPRRRVPRGGGRPLLHRVPQGPRRRQDRQRPRPGHRHRLLAPPCQRHPQGRGHRGARRRGTPPRRQPLRIGRVLPGYAAEGHPGADRIPLKLAAFC